LAFFKFDLA